MNDISLLVVFGIGSVYFIAEVILVIYYFVRKKIGKKNVCEPKSESKNEEKRHEKA